MINKKIVMFIGMVLLAAGVAYASGVVFFGGNAYEDSDDKLVLDIDLTEANYVSGTKTFADDSGEGNDGVSNNAATFTTDKYGKSTGAVSFNNVYNYVDLSSDIVFNITTENYTFSMWHYIPTDSGTEWKGFTGGVLAVGGYWMYHSGGKLGFYQDYYDSTLYWWMSDLNLGDEIPYDTWTHITVKSIAINNTHTNLTAYINGGQYYDSTIMLNSPRPITIFKFSEIGRGDSSRYFNGSISQVKVWNRSLSATEVGALYNSSKPKASAGSRHKGLVGHWALDSDGYNSNTERITDKTPYENHGTNSGATLTTDQMGQSNRAMSFGGGDDIIDLSSVNDNLNEMTGTICMWSNWKSVDNEAFPSLFSTREVSDYIEIYESDGGFYFRYGDGANSLLYTYGTILNKWSHWCFTWDNSSSANIYENGINVSKYSGSWTAVNQIGDFVLGGLDGQTNGNFNGSISDVRIYDRVLSADEIDTLYHSYRPKAASGSLYKGLVFDMPLKSKYTKDETVGSEIMTDRTPYSNDGQNYGATVGSSYTTFVPNDYIDCGDGIDFTNAIFSASIWVYPTTTTSDTYIGKWETAAHPGNNSWLLMGNAGTMLFYIEESDNDSITSSAPGAYIVDNWYHVVGVANGSTLKLYVDGALKDEDPYDGTINPGIQNLVIGIFYGNYPFNGDMSSAKIYNRALSESEIKLLYDKGR